MLTEDYRVRLESFEGPLDLLLFLIRRAEVDIHDIPVAAIADQYMDFLRQIDRIDIDAAGEFLVMAASLVEIKSRMLAWKPGEPRAQEAECAADDGADPRADLVRELLAYRQYREAASTLERRLDEWQRRFSVSIRPPQAPPAGEPDLELDDLNLLDLVEAFRRIMETVNFDRLGEHQVAYDDTPIELHAEDILSRLRTDPAGELSMAGLFSGRRRAEMIGLFMAMLELVRRRALRVRQDSLAGEILLRLAPRELASVEGDAAAPQQRAEPLAEDKVVLGELQAREVAVDVAEHQVDAPDPRRAPAPGLQQLDDPRG